MARRLLSRVGGFVHDIDTVASLSDEPNNIRLLSDRSLYILQNLSLEDVTFLSRYGEMLGGDLYLPVLAGTPNASEVNDAIDLIRRDLNSMGVEELLQCICENIGLLSEAAAEAEARAGAESTTSDIPPSDGSISVGPGEKFPTQEAYYNAKCNVANGIFDTILGSVDWLDSNVTALLAGGFGGVTSALLFGLVISGPVGWGVILAEATIGAISAMIVGYVLNFDDISDALGEQHTELVTALYNAGNALQASENFITELDNAATPTTALEQELVSLMLTNSVLNQLFDIGDTVVSYDSPDPVVCGSVLQRWPFTASGEGWVFRDDSTGSYSASGVWNSGAEAWRITLVGPGTGTGPRSEGKIFITGLSIVVGIGNSVQFDHSASEDGVVTGRNIKVVFSDASEQYFDAPSTSGPGTAVMSIEKSETIEEIEIGLSRNWQYAFNTYRDINEVRVV